MRTADTLLTNACNWLAFHPRLTCALLCGLILIVGRADMRWLP